MKRIYHSLEDFLISNPLTVDGVLDDGWGGKFSIKGCELEAAVLFADMSNFSKRTQDLSPTETLILVNKFFTWISAEAISRYSCIVDKYIGDEIMVLFSNQFGSENPFIDAVHTARWIAENDAWGFGPHIGISAGLVTIGFVGTPLKYNCSAFGRAVTIASRCAGIKPDEAHSASIVFPAELWEGYVFEEIFPPERLQHPDGRTQEHHNAWKISDSHKRTVKNTELEVREIFKTSTWYPSQSVEENVKDSLRTLKNRNLYRG